MTEPRVYTPTPLPTAVEGTALTPLQIAIRDAQRDRTEQAIAAVYSAARQSALAQNPTAHITPTAAPSYYAARMAPAPVPQYAGPIVPRWALKAAAAVALVGLGVWGLDLAVTELDHLVTSLGHALGQAAHVAVDALFLVGGGFLVLVLLRALLGGGEEKAGGPAPVINQTVRSVFGGSIKNRW